jgi:hypothetical protein
LTRGLGHRVKVEKDEVGHARAVTALGFDQSMGSAARPQSPVLTSEVRN